MYMKRDITKAERLDVDMINRVIRSLRDGSRNGVQATGLIDPIFHNAVHYRNDMHLEFHSTRARRIQNRMASAWADNTLTCLTTLPERRLALDDCLDFRRRLLDYQKQNGTWVPRLVVGVKA